MTDYFLLLIDIQKLFTAVTPELLDACINEIEQAKQKHKHILYLRLRYGGHIFSNLTKLTRRYEKAHVRTKTTNSGYTSVSNFIKKFNAPRYVRICGVNLDFCVYDTVLDLSKKNVYIDIIENAVGLSNSNLYDNKQSCLDDLSHILNCNVIYSGV